MDTKAHNMWLKRVLIPFWVVEIIWLLAVLILCCLEYTDYEILYPEGGIIFNISTWLLVFFSAVSLAIDITAIVLFATHKLHPTLYLVGQAINCFLWTLVFVYSAASSTYASENTLSWLFTTVLLLTTWGQLMYSFVIVRRHHLAQRSHKGYISSDRAPGYASPRSDHHALGPPQTFELRVVRSTAAPPAPPEYVDMPSPVSPAFAQRVELPSPTLPAYTQRVELPSPMSSTFASSGGWTGDSKGRAGSEAWEVEKAE